MVRICKNYDGFDGTENFDYVSPRNKNLIHGMRGDYQIELMPMGTSQHGKYVVWYQNRDVFKWYGLAVVKTNTDAHIAKAEGVFSGGKPTSKALPTLDPHLRSFKEIYIDSGWKMFRAFGWQKGQNEQ